MCWSSKTLEKRIATKDIKTFKIGFIKNDRLYSYYKYFLYDFNRLYETTIHSELLGEFYMINQGFHSYNPKKCSYFCNITYRHIDVQSKITGELIDRYYDNLIFIYDIIVFKCIIPKGTVYYENEHGEIVSEAIIIKQVKHIEE